MTRDFMGLSSNLQLAVVKEEDITDSPNDSGFAKGSGSRWPNLNKAHGLAHFMSFDSSQEDKPKRVAAADLFDHTQKGSIGELQNMAGVDFSKQQTVGGVPFTATHPTLYSAGSVAGFTEFCNGAKASGFPAQLTVFYAGTVNVFEDISPEKAQAIMFLAGNSVCPMASNAGPQMNQFLPPSSKLAVANDNVNVKQTMNAPPSAAVSSPLSVSSHNGAQSGTGSTTNNELAQGKTLEDSAPRVPTSDTSKLINTIRPVSIAALMQSAVPQARKASLARFLEKRKERVMNAAAPYEIGKKASECASSEWNGSNLNLSANSGMGCGPL